MTFMLSENAVDVQVSLQLEMSSGWSNNGLEGKVLCIAWLGIENEYRMEI